ncbi:MAG: anti-sigma F factor antagonist [Epulopiscium sp. Nele67-Bin005]|nr:MAG: anti-sigma F factor antagonist [Epulopiscium sp. Nele67-Bin005]
MKIKTEVQNNILVVRLDGEIDHHSSTLIKETVDQLYQKHRVRHILFDFKDVTFMDSSGIGMLMGRYRSTIIGGGKVMLVEVKPEVDKILQLSGIYKLMKLYKDETVAVANL